MTWICYRGIELSAETQVFLLSAEILILGAFSVVALCEDLPRDGVAGIDAPELVVVQPVRPVVQRAHSAACCSGSSSTGAGTRAWPSTKRSKDSAEAPGKAAVLSTVLLVLIYLVVATSAQAFAGTKFLASNSNDVLNAARAERLRLALVQAADHRRPHVGVRVDPDDDPAHRADDAVDGEVAGDSRTRSGSIHPRYLTPTLSTLGMGALSAVWTAFLLLVDTSGNVLNDSITALGFAVCFYYGFTGSRVRLVLPEGALQERARLHPRGTGAGDRRRDDGLHLRQGVHRGQRRRLQLLDAGLRNPDPDPDRDRLAAPRHSADDPRRVQVPGVLLQPQDRGGARRASWTSCPKRKETSRPGRGLPPRPGRCRASR